MTDAGQNAPADVVSHYRLICPLGAGGMGEVYLAHDTHLDRKVAIKFLTGRSSDPDAHQRLLHEARAAAALDHPNICSVYEVSASWSPPFIVMQYVEGETLASRLRRGALPPDTAIRLATEVADALSTAHQRGIVHRDVKPQNIMLTRGGHAKLLDFGLARHRAPDVAISSDATQTVSHGGIVGTPAYMAPEQIHNGAIDGRTDLFALGAVLYESLTARAPFSGGSQLDVFAAILHTEPPPPSSVVPGLTPAHDELCARLLRKSPEERFQTAGEVLTALREIDAGNFRSSGVRPSPPPSRRRPWLIAAAVAAAVAVTASTWMLRQPSVAPGPSPQAERFYYDGIAALREAAYAQADRALAKAVELDPDFPLGWARLAEVQLELDNEDRANASVLRAVGLAGDGARLGRNDRLVLDATIGMATRDFAKAQASYETLVQEQPGSAPLRLDLGRAYEAGEAIDRAIEQYLAASEADPENPAAFLRLGVLYGRQDRASDALEAFGHAEALYDAGGRLEGVAAVAFHRGVVLSRLGDRARQARESLERAQQLAESLRSTYLHAAALFRLSSLAGMEGRYEEAEQLARRALDVGQDLDSLTAFGLVDLGNVFVYSERYDRAGEYFEQALRLARASGARRAEARARLALGSLQMSRGQVKDATAHAQLALDYYDQAGFRSLGGTARTLLAQGQARSGDLAGAERTHRELLAVAEQRKVPSQIAEQHYQLAAVLLMRERYEAALEQCDKALDRYRSVEAPYDRLHALLLRVGILARLGRFEDAERGLDAVNAVPSAAEVADPGIQLHYDRVLRQSALALVRGEPAVAERYLRAASSHMRDTSPSPESGAEHSLLLGLAQVRSGRAADGLARLESARAAAGNVVDWVLASRLTLAKAEALLAAGRPAEALSESAALAGRLEQEGRFESAWLGYSVAARSAGLAGQKDAAADLHARAGRARAALEATMSRDAWTTFRRRKDLPS